MGSGAGVTGMAEHQHAIRIIEHGLCYDELMLTPLASMELVIRRPQLVELKHENRVLSHRGSEVEEDENFYLEGAHGQPSVGGAHGHRVRATRRRPPSGGVI